MEEFNKKSGAYLLFYIIIGALHLVFTHLDYVPGIYYSKGVLMPLLLAWLWTSEHRITKRHLYYLSIALFFSFIGDIVLMLAQDRKELFLLGLSAFLCAHLFYIVTFIGESTIQLQPYRLLKKQVYWYIPFISYAAILLYLTKDYLIQHNLLLPVAVYAAILCTMVLSALNRYGNVPILSFRWVFIGAVLFLLSDSLIAIARFYYPFVYNRDIIMFAYIVAQGLIIGGEIKR